MINALDLFSGYGGISYGLREYVKPIAYCEIDEYARAVLASRISEGELSFAPIITDVKSIRGQVGAADIILGGFPCQDISVAGNGKGLEGERSGLFFEIIRLTKEIAPTFVFLENVPAIRTRGLRQVVGAFTEMGYDCRWTCLSASSVGAPHKRERWFMLAHANSTKLRKQYGRSSREDREKKILIRVYGKDGNITNSASKRLEGNQRNKSTNLQPPKLYEQKWLEVEPAICGSNYGPSFGVDRIKALGNGVVPLQVKKAFEKLMGIEVIEE